MKRLFAVVSTSTFACAMAIAPVLADTTSGASNSTSSALQHDLDCLALMFTNPTQHAQQCGGPTFNPAPPPSSGGFGTACHSAEIAPLDITATVIKSDADMLVAGPDPCCLGELTVPLQQQLGPLFDTLWSRSDSWLVTVTATPCR